MTSVFFNDRTLKKNAYLNNERLLFSVLGFSGLNVLNVDTHNQLNCGCKVLC